MVAMAELLTEDIWVCLKERLEIWFRGIRIDPRRKFRDSDSESLVVNFDRMIFDIVGHEATLRHDRSDWL